ncbi:hypothetical protein ACFQ0X_42685 [Streptomyces rectiviolaceus]|uniref:Alpha/beta hydrolase n=1 Tax=Streptomyces rectiviolaceus TaxID=332591 RepID=A0ABP6MJE8_9ACTN
MGSSVLDLSGEPVPGQRRDPRQFALDGGHSLPFDLPDLPELFARTLTEFADRHQAEIAGAPAALRRA